MSAASTKTDRPADPYEALLAEAAKIHGVSLWMVDRGKKSVRYLTAPAPTALDVDPSFASR